MQTDDERIAICKTCCCILHSSCIQKMTRVNTCPFCRNTGYNQTFYTTIPSESDLVKKLRLLSKTHLSVQDMIPSEIQLSAEEVVKFLNICDILRQDAIVIKETKKRIQEIKLEKLNLNDTSLVNESEDYQTEMLLQKRRELETEILQFKIEKLKFEEEKKRSVQSKEEFCTEFLEQFQKMVRDNKVQMYAEAEADITRRKDTFERQMEIDIQQLKCQQQKFIEAEIIRKNAEKLKAEYEDKMQKLNDDIEKQKKIFKKASKLHLLIKETKQIRTDCLVIHKNTERYRDEISYELAQIKRKAEADEKFRLDLTSAHIFCDKTNKYLDIEDIVEYIELVKGLVEDAISIKRAHSEFKDAPYRMATTFLSATNSILRNKVKKRMNKK
jgi:hypothetical protein